MTRRSATRPRIGFVARALLLCAVAGACAGCGGGCRPSRSVAVTIDDLPLAAAQIFSPEDRRRIVTTLCALLRARGLPATGFVNMSVAEEIPELLPFWKRTGIELGNHTWSHPDLNEVGAAVFIEDLRRGHEALRAEVPPGRPIPFRYPFLSEGADPETRDAVRAVLAELGSPVAPVTILTRDWYFSTGFSRARMAGDDEAAARWVEGWEQDMHESTVDAETLSRELFGHEPPQILLIHANEISALYLGRYLDWLEQRGYRFVPLADALADPAYREPDLSTFPEGRSHWVRLQRSRALAAAEVGSAPPQPAGH